MQWYHDEVTLSHQRMRYLQVRLVNSQIVVQQDVDVNRPVGEYTMRRLADSFCLPATHIPLYLLGDVEQLHGAQLCLHGTHRIGE